VLVLKFDEVTRSSLPSPFTSAAISPYPSLPYEETVEKVPLPAPQ